MEKWERSVGFVKLANWLIDWSFLLALSSSFTIPLFPHTFTWVLLYSRFLAQDLQKHGPSSGRFRKMHHYSTWMTKLLNLSCAAVTETGDRVTHRNSCWLAFLDDGKSDMKVSVCIKAKWLSHSPWDRRKEAEELQFRNTNLTRTVGLSWLNHLLKILLLSLFSW